MNLDPAIATFLAAIPADAPDFADMSLEDTRTAIAGMQDVTGPGLPVATVRDLQIPGDCGAIPARLYHPEPGVELPLLVMLFGGGFIAGSIEVIDTPVRQLAVLGRVAVLTPSYRLAPEHPYPAAVQDVESVVRWAAESARELGADATRIAIGGESAGGGLALSAALRFGPGALSALVLIYPVLDTDFDTPTYRAYAEGHLLTRAAMRRFWGDYVGVDPAFAPSDAVPGQAPDLSGLPPTLLAVGQHDVLRSENETFLGRVIAAGVPVQSIRWPDLTHASWYFDRVSSSAATANQDLARRIGGLLHS